MLVVATTRKGCSALPATGVSSGSVRISVACLSSPDPLPDIAPSPESREDPHAGSSAKKSNSVVKDHATRFAFMSAPAAKRLFEFLIDTKYQF
jgi:hypothetical protein